MIARGHFRRFSDRPPGERGHGSADPAGRSIVRSLSVRCGVLVVMLSTGNRAGRRSRSRRLGLASTPTMASTPMTTTSPSKLIFDRLSVPFLVLSFVLCGTIGGVRDKLHAPRAGVQPLLRAVRAVPARHGDGLAGRHDRDAVRRAGSWSGCRARCSSRSSTSGRPRSRNGLRVWIVYRVSDAALLLAAVVHAPCVGAGDFDQLLGTRAMARRARRR